MSNINSLKTEVVSFRFVSSEGLTFLCVWETKNKETFYSTHNKETINRKEILWRLDKETKNKESLYCLEQVD